MSSLRLVGAQQRAGGARRAGPLGQAQLALQLADLGVRVGEPGVDLVQQRLVRVAAVDVELLEQLLHFLHLHLIPHFCVQNGLGDHVFPVVEALALPPHLGDLLSYLLLLRSFLGARGLELRGQALAGLALGRGLAGQVGGPTLEGADLLVLRGDRPGDFRALGAQLLLGPPELLPVALEIVLELFNGTLGLSLVAFFLLRHILYLGLELEDEDELLLVGLLELALLALYELVVFL